MSKKHRYLFKITVIGPEDKLLEGVLKVINEDVIAIDGVRITATSLESEKFDIQAVTMAPQQSALETLESLTFTGANAVFIILNEADPKIETIYRNKIRENLGSGVPTKVCVVSDKITSKEKDEIVKCFNEMVEELTPPS